MSVFTTGKLGSFVLGGAGLGLFTCNAQCAATMLLVISAVATVVWAFLLLGSSCQANSNGEQVPEWMLLQCWLYRVSVRRLSLQLVLSSRFPSELEHKPCAQQTLLQSRAMQD